MPKYSFQNLLRDNGCSKRKGRKLAEVSRIAEQYNVSGQLNYRYVTLYVTRPFTIFSFHLQMNFIITFETQRRDLRMLVASTGCPSVRWK